MFPILGTNMNHYASSSPAYPGSSPYAIPDQPPFTNGLTRHHSQWRSSGSDGDPPTYGFVEPRSRHYSTSSSSGTSRRKPSLFSLRSNSRSSTSTATSSSSSAASLVPAGTNDSLARSTSGTSSTRSSSLASIKSFFTPDTPEQKRAKKAVKERKKRVERAEKAAYERAQEMEASALYMAWRYGEGSNNVSYAMY